MGPRSAFCAAAAATDRQDDLTAGLGGEALPWGRLGVADDCYRWMMGLGASRPSPHLTEAGSWRGAIGLALAGPGSVWAWAWV